MGRVFDADQKCCFLPILSCSPGASAGESSEGAEAPAGKCFAVPLSLALAQHNWFFSEKALGRQRESGKVVLLQSDEGLGGLEALSGMAGRGQTGGTWTSFPSVWAMKPPSPWHQRCLLGTIVPSPCWWLVGGSWSHPTRASCDPLSTTGSSSTSGVLSS